MPTTRDGFSYDGRSFYVTVDAHRHERHDSELLYSLLTHVTPLPVPSTSAGQVANQQPEPHKDPAGHFYVAQLLLYGLAPVKTKSAMQPKRFQSLLANRF